jgi:O6-methylguanine-DNA--protein-cysteine methyltransferase
VGGRFKKEATLPQSKGLRLPRDLEVMVEALAKQVVTTRSEVLRQLVTDQLAVLAGRAKTVEEILKIAVNAADEQARRTQALSTIEQGAIVRVERQVTQLGGNLLARCDRIDQRLDEIQSMCEEVRDQLATLASGEEGGR